MADTAVVVKETTKSKIREPKKYKVIMLNDDYTPMEFVVAVLVSIFRKSDKEAINVMMQVHNEGSAVAGIYNYEIAEQKSVEATNLARDNSYPLQIKIEAE